MNYLKSALPNAIIMNYGDNDTFPLWYAQEVEGVRTDVRVMNMSYLGADWYIDQMKLKSNDSDPVPFTLPRDKYTYRNDYLPIKERFKSATAKQVIDEWIRLDDPVTKVTTPFRNGRGLHSDAENRDPGQQRERDRQRHR